MMNCSQRFGRTNRWFPIFICRCKAGRMRSCRKMNRQYVRDDFLRLVDRLHAAFDRPALTTDIIVGFPGESDAAFDQTLEVVDRSRFIHIHAFPFSPRPGTAAARWQSSFVRGPIVNRANRFAPASGRCVQPGFPIRFRQSNGSGARGAGALDSRTRACITAAASDISMCISKAKPLATGDLVGIQIDRVTPTRTFGTPTLSSQ